MSTEHILHYILEPGLDGNGFTEPEAAVLRKKTDALNIVSADHYSNLNDGLTDVGPGGTLILSPNVEYAQDEPLRPLNNQTIQGDSRFGSVIKYTGEAGIAAPVLGQRVEGLRVFNLTLDGNDVGGMGIDARGFSQCHFDFVRIWNPTSHGVWWGGDTTEGGWTNTFSRGLVRAPNVGAAMYFKGRTSPTGAATGNKISVWANTIYSKSLPTSYGVFVEEGESNVFDDNDYGYGVDCGAAIYLKSEIAARNRFTNGRTENVKRGVLIEGARRNTFLANAFGLYVNSEFHGAEIYSGSLLNVFRDNWWDAKGLGPRVWEDNPNGGYQTLIDDLDSGTLSQFVNSQRVQRSSGQVAFSAGVQSETYERWRILTSGVMQWISPGDGSAIATLKPATDNSGMEWGDNTYVKTPRVTGGMPAASAAYRGVIVMVHGGTGVKDRFWACQKDATNTYVWKEVAFV